MHRMPTKTGKETRKEQRQRKAEERRKMEEEAEQLREREEAERAVEEAKKKLEELKKKGKQAGGEKSKPPPKKGKNSKKANSEKEAEDEEVDGKDDKEDSVEETGDEEDKMFEELLAKREERKKRRREQKKAIEKKGKKKPKAERKKDTPKTEDEEKRDSGETEEIEEKDRKEDRAAWEERDRRAKEDRDKMKEYTPTEEWEGWLEYVEGTYASHWDDKRKIRFILDNLPQEMRLRAASLQYSGITLREFTGKVKDFAKKPADKSVKSQEYVRICREPGEQYAQYYKRMREAWSEAGEQSEEKLWEAFRSNLSADELEQLDDMSITDHEKMKARIPFAGRWEGVRKLEKKKTAVILAAQVTQRAQAGQAEQKVPPERGQKRPRTCFHCGQQDHVARFCPMVARVEREAEEGRREGKRTEKEGKETGRYDREPDWLKDLAKACEQLKQYGQMPAGAQNAQATTNNSSQAHPPRTSSQVQKAPAQTQRTTDQQTGATGGQGGMEQDRRYSQYSRGRGNAPPLWDYNWQRNTPYYTSTGQTYRERGGGNGFGGGSGRGYGRGGGISRFCSWCRKAGHTEERCFIKNGSRAGRGRGRAAPMPLR